MAKNIQAKKKAILDRIEHYNEALAKGREYVESGKHASWHGFRPLFKKNVKDGELAPPHKDWVKNVFLPRQEKELRHSEKVLERLIASEKDST